MVGFNPTKLFFPGDKKVTRVEILAKAQISLFEKQWSMEEWGHLLWQGPW